MNNASKKTLMFAPMSRSAGQKANNSHVVKESNKRTPMESGAVFRSVSMGVMETPQLFGTGPLQGSNIFRKSNSTPLPAHRPSSPCEDLETEDEDVKVMNLPTSIPVQDNADASDWVWTLEPEKLKSVPMFHPVERTAITVEDIPLPTITSRISTFLKMKSIPADYEDDIGRVSCMTDGLLKFVVQLWRNTNSGEGVIVEIQRRQGCCVAMQAIRHALIEAIQTGTKSEGATRVSRSTCRFVQDLLDKSGLPPPPSHLACGAAALVLARNLLESERIDAQRLGLESLCSLTDPAQVLLRDADEVCYTLLTDPTWQRLLMRYFMPIHVNPGEQVFYAPMHLLALKVLTQAVESVASTGKQISVDFTDSFWRPLFESLFLSLSVASQLPSEAAWAIRCFRLLESIQPDVLDMIPSKQELYESLRHARDFGKQHNLSLEQETEQWMGRLGMAY